MGWDQVAAGGGGGGKWLRFANDGDSAVVHILTEDPKSYFQVYNNAIKKGAVVSEEFKGKKGMKHAFEVLDMADWELKILSVSSATGAGLKNIFDNYGGTFGEVDIKITRKGTGLKTTYLTLPLKLKFTDAMLEGKERIDLETEEGLQPNDEAGTAVLAGNDPDLEFPPADEAAETPAEEAAEETPAEEVPAEDASAEEELAPPPAKTKPAPAKAAPKAAPAAAVDPRTALIRKVMHAFASKPKFKDPKARLAELKKVTKKTIVSQLSIDELTKLSKAVA